MTQLAARSRRAVLPVCVFAATMLLHFAWGAIFPERDPLQDQWTAVPSLATGPWASYIEGQNYWLGFSYGSSVAFAASAFRQYRERRRHAARNMAIGGITFSGVLSVVGCYLLGCCGSPMLTVYLNLLGARFIPLAKPLMALLTALSIAAAWWWLNRTRLSPTCCASGISSCDDAACCEESGAQAGRKP